MSISVREPKPAREPYGEDLALGPYPLSGALGCQVLSGSGPALRCSWLLTSLALKLHIHRESFSLLLTAHVCNHEARTSSVTSVFKDVMMFPSGRQKS